MKDRTLACTVERKTPYEIFFNEKPSVKYLKLYGSRVYVKYQNNWENQSGIIKQV